MHTIGLANHRLEIPDFLQAKVMNVKKTVWTSATSGVDHPKEFTRTSPTVRSVNYLPEMRKV